MEQRTRGRVLRDSSEAVDGAQPTDEWVPSEENLGHQILKSPQTHAGAKVKRFDRLKFVFC